MRRKIIDFLVWGFLLWFIGYMLGMIFFALLPQSLIGWAILPIGMVVTLWVLFKKIKSKQINYYLTLAFFWTTLAIILDYFFIVKMLKPADGYYKLDVYIYYSLTLLMPIGAGLFKAKK